MLISIKKWMKYLLRVIFIVLISVAFIPALNSCKRVTVPTVTTVEITGITQTNAVSGGNVIDDGGAKIYGQGISWNNIQNPTLASRFVNDRTGTSFFNLTMFDLTPNTTYYVRAYAFNSEGISYGNEVSFSTSPIVLAIVSTTDVTSIGAVRAVCGGSITFNGGATIIAKGICWDTKELPTIGLTTKTIDGTGTESFTSEIKGLLPNTTYYVRAYATNSLGTAYGDQHSFKTDAVIFNPDLTYGSVSDTDGNTYKTIKIGTQTWMAENLKTTKFNDGTTIEYSGNSVFREYCWYDNDVKNKEIYGGLYDWGDVSTYKLCPVKWHVPSYSEWKTLITFLGGETVAGGKLKETDTLHWHSPNTGATNESGFTALPGGKRFEGGGFYGIGKYSNWWSSSQSGGGITQQTATSCHMVYNGENIISDYDLKPAKLSVRCIKDIGPKLNTAPLTNKTLINGVNDTLILQSGGYNIDDHGSEITHKGVCWNFNGNPQIDYYHSHTDEGGGSGSFISIISTRLQGIEQIIYVRAYATNSEGTGYGEELWISTRH